MGEGAAGKGGLADLSRAKNDHSREALREFPYSGGCQAVVHALYFRSCHSNVQG